MKYLSKLHSSWVPQDWIVCILVASITDQLDVPDTEVGVLLFTRSKHSDCWSAREKRTEYMKEIYIYFSTNTILQTM